VVNPSAPEGWLAQGEPLHYTTKGMAGVNFKPYFAVNADDVFATTPAFDVV
jgi:hypothetical protein